MIEQDVRALLARHNGAVVLIIAAAISVVVFILRKAIIGIKSAIKTIDDIRNGNKVSVETVIELLSSAAAAYMAIHAGIFGVFGYWITRKVSNAVVERFEAYSEDSLENKLATILNRLTRSDTFRAKAAAENNVFAEIIRSINDYCVSAIETIMEVIQRLEEEGENAIEYAKERITGLITKTEKATNVLEDLETESKQIVETE